MDNWQLVVQKVDQAIYNHEQWYKDVTRTISCRLPYDLRDVADDAHRQCRFGQWYYGPLPDELRNHPAFIALEGEHTRMHRFAAQLLRAAANEVPSSTSDYDNYINALDRFRLELFTLKREIEESLLSRDPLTGTQNRISMLTKMREALEPIKRNLGQCCIAMADLDHFKSINDTYGHQIGDQVLVAAASYMMKHLRPYDKIFRYGGEEFLIMMPTTDMETGLAAAERICDGLSGTAVAIENGKPISITASFGVALLDPDVGIEESIDHADKALYSAKADGRNCVRRWH